ncbi:hypothetical protein BB560_003458 [Smittium megazygosporum]|uniref:Uncharacterized protein n=1 Tax=Smittium megazygosporum TaxID=133381 RepID=A0A2T9ZBX6_9FUNG|nr:hypothetical protein BB560_003458 [Smittium megazygosporum]
MLQADWKSATTFKRYYYRPKNNNSKPTSSTSAIYSDTINTPIVERTFGPSNKRAKTITNTSTDSASFGYKYCQYTLFDNSVCYSRNSIRRNWTCFTGNGYEKRVCRITRNGTYEQTNCSSDPTAVFESIQGANTCSIMTTTDTYALKANICQCRSIGPSGIPRCNTPHNVNTTIAIDTKSITKNTAPTTAISVKPPFSGSSSLTSPSTAETTSTSTPSTASASTTMSTSSSVEPVCPDSGYSYNSYRINGTQICILCGKSTNPRSCFEMSNTVTKFIDYLYNRPSVATDMI